jgi:hypothetical protein
MTSAVIAISLDKIVIILQFIKQNTKRKYPGIMSYIDKIRIIDKKPGVYFATFNNDDEKGCSIKVGDLIEDTFIEKDDSNELIDCDSVSEWWK